MYPFVLAVKREATPRQLHLRLGHAVEFGVRGSVEMLGFQLARPVVCRTSSA